MTTRTTTPLICECGHEGSLYREESDQPYSEPWERVTLHGFKEGRLDAPSSDIRDDVRGICPECGSTNIKLKPR